MNTKEDAWKKGRNEGEYSRFTISKAEQLPNDNTIFCRNQPPAKNHGIIKKT